MKSAVLVLSVLITVALCASVEQPGALYGKSLELLKSGDIQKAFEAFQTAVSKDCSIISEKTTRVSGYYLRQLEKKTSMLNIAKAYFIAGDLDKADTFLRKVMSLYPSTSKEYWEATALREQIKKVDKRITQLARSGSARGNSPAVRSTRQTDRMDLQVFHRAIGKGGNLPPTRYKTKSSR